MPRKAGTTDETKYRAPRVKKEKTVEAKAPSTLPFNPDTRHYKEPTRSLPHTRRAAAARTPIADRWRLQNDKGLYLRYDGKAFVNDVRLAWWGITAQVECMIKQQPELAALRRVPYGL